MIGPNRVATSAAVITPDTPVTAGSAVMIACSAAGDQKLKLKSGSVITVPMAEDEVRIIYNIAVIDAPSSGTTATCVVTVLS